MWKRKEIVYRKWIGIWWYGVCLRILWEFRSRKSTTIYKCIAYIVSGTRFSFFFLFFFAHEKGKRLNAKKWVILLWYNLVSSVDNQIRVESLIRRKSKPIVTHLHTSIVPYELIITENSNENSFSKIHIPCFRIESIIKTCTKPTVEFVFFLLLLRSGVCLCYSACFVNANAIFVWIFRDNRFVEIIYTHSFDARKHNSHVSTVHIIISSVGWLQLYAFMHAFVAVKPLTHHLLPLFHCRI